MSGGSQPAGFHLLDVSALVVGYGLASLLIRAYWPNSGPDGALTVSLAGLVFAWLGLAMSGPVVLLTRRPPPDEPGEEAAGSRTWAELAWMIIGFYWIGLTVLVVPVRMNGARLLDSAILGVFPVLAALGLRFFGPRPTRRAAREEAAGWTHRMGVVLLASWPFAWAGLILLGKSL
jgi:apolipoprotein N-acyltransferase